MIKEKKRDWTETEFTHKVRISEEDLNYIKKIKGKKSIAGKISEIINKHRKGGDET